MNDVPKQRPKRRWVGIVATTLICLSILAASAVGIVVINRTEPTAQQIDAKRVSAALVETLTVQRKTYAPSLVVLGTVQPAQDITLSPRVSGQVVEITSPFAPGETVSKGELLLRIDPFDFEQALSVSESELAQREASLKIEQGRQSLGEKELSLVEGTIEGIDTALVLRKPQIASINAQVKAAQAQVEQARTDLERTRVTAPFDAHILSRSVNVGSQVSPGEELGRLVGIEEYWIMASVPVRSLRWVQFPEEDQEGSTVTLRDPNTWAPGAEREAHVTRMIGTLDQQSRLARVLVTVADPLARNIDAPPLILNTLLEVEIEGRPIENVVRLKRDYVRDADTVWVMADGELEIRTVDVVFQDADYAYIQEGLSDGEDIVTTTLATVANGIRLRRVSEEAASGRDATEEDAH